MKYEDINRELKSIFPHQFGIADRESLKELSSMSFPKGFVKFYSENCPTAMLDFGKISLLNISELINENIWELPGEDLYEKGFSIVGFAPEGKIYCLNMKEKNKTGENDVLLVAPELDYSIMSHKEARNTMKFVGHSFELFLAKELEFARKARS